jgi:hypothetical protein
LTDLYFQAYLTDVHRTVQNRTVQALLLARLRRYLIHLSISSRQKNKTAIDLS